MKKLIGSGLAALSLGLIGAPAAHAYDEPFISCGYGAGIATSVTSCEFAYNVRSAWYHQSGNVVLAYSPVTGGIYNMQCAPGFIATFYDGSVVNSVRCVGGNNAVVVVW